MFKSKVRPINITQYEHGRMCGELAARWGNADFDRPEIDFDKVVSAVALHDWHYRLIDDLPITEASDADWLAITRKGVSESFDDPTVDILVKRHLKRLLSFGIHVTDEVPALIQQIDDLIARRLPETGYTLAQFEWADKITRFCDFLVFDFCFEAEQTRQIGVCARIGDPAETVLQTAILPNGRIRVDPWPFDQPSFSGLIIGHEREGYPDVLTPLVIPYSISTHSS